MITGIVAGMLLFTSGFLSRSFWHDGEGTIQSAGNPPAPALLNNPPDEVRTAHADVPHDNDKSATTATPRTRTIHIRTTDTVYRQSPPLNVVEYRDRVLHDTVYAERDIPIAAAQPIHADFLAAEPIIVQPLWKRIDVSLQREHVTTFPYVNYQRLGADRVQQQYTLSAAYNFDEHHAAGVMIGRKPFAQEYHRIERDSMYLYQQQPDLVFGAGFYRLSMPIRDIVTPQLAISVGGTDLGPVIGAQLSIAVTPVRPLTLYVGSNASLLLFRFKDRLFTSHTLGFLYGMSLRF
jgi:hypothetical protein